MMSVAELFGQYTRQGFNVSNMSASHDDYYSGDKHCDYGPGHFDHPHEDGHYDKD